MARRALWVCAVVVSMCLIASAGAAEPLREPDVIFVPTPPNVVEKMLELAKVTQRDLLYDLGCGDGRIPIIAAKKYGCKAVGYDIDPRRIAESRRNVDANGVGKLVTIEHKNIFTLDLSDANVVTLYLLPSLNAKLIPQLEKLKPGSRIVSHDFDMKGVAPDQVVTVQDARDPGHTHKVYLWTTPLKRESHVPDVLYIPTPQKVVEKMLELAKVSKKDVVYDLGCGDGRIPITAARQYGCKAVGYDIDPRRVAESRRNVDANGVGRLVTIEQRDIFTLDLKGASVITLYLLPELNVKLIPQLEKLKPGLRIVSHDFDMKGVIPDQVLVVPDDKDPGTEHRIYLWTAPLKREPPLELRRPDVVYVPTPPHVVEKMLELAQVNKADVVYDLGCGDGRIPILAAKQYGCRAFGYDIDPRRVAESRRNVDANGVGNLVTIEQRDIFTLDLSGASVVTLYLLPSLNVKLIPQLEKLKPGSRIVSHEFDMQGVTPDRVVDVPGVERSPLTRRVYLWTTPLKKAQQGR